MLAWATQRATSGSAACGRGPGGPAAGALGRPRSTSKTQPRMRAIASGPSASHASYAPDVSSTSSASCSTARDANQVSVAPAADQADFSSQVVQGRQVKGASSWTSGDCLGGVGPSERASACWLRLSRNTSACGTFERIYVALPFTLCPVRITLCPVCITLCPVCITRYHVCITRYHVCITRYHVLNREELSRAVGLQEPRLSFGEGLWCTHPERG
eukprot:359194-Chlamydomonas_euryale.AAC.19